MKPRHTRIPFMAIVALAFAVFGDLHGSSSAYAQTRSQQPDTERISFAPVSITSGQSIRLNIANTRLPNSALPPDPCRVVLTFVDSDGNFFRGRNGQVIRRIVMLEAGKSTSLELNADDFGGISTVRMQLRAIATIHPPPIPDEREFPPYPCVPSIVVFNNANGRTQFVVAALPAVQRFQSSSAAD